MAPPYWKVPDFSLEFSTIKVTETDLLQKTEKREIGNLLRH